MTDMPALLKSIAAELRLAANALLVGKPDEAMVQAESAAGSLAAAKAHDPDNPQIVLLDAQLDSLQKDLGPHASAKARLGLPVRVFPPPADAAPPK